MAEPDIREHICRELSHGERRAALEFTAYLETLGLTLHRDNSPCWRDKLYYWVMRGESCVCFIAISDPDEEQNRWTVWSEDIGTELPEDYPVTRDLMEAAWRYVDLCGHCGSCGGGRRRTVFGREFSAVCGCTFRVDNADESALPFLRALVDIRLRELSLK